MLGETSLYTKSQFFFFIFFINRYRVSTRWFQRCPLSLKFYLTLRFISPSNPSDPKYKPRLYHRSLNPWIFHSQNIKSWAFKECQSLESCISMSVNVTPRQHPGNMRIFYTPLDFHNRERAFKLLLRLLTEGRLYLHLKISFEAALSCTWLQVYTKIALFVPCQPFKKQT